MKTKRIAQLWLITMAIIALTALPALAALVAYYPMDGNANDASGNGYNGTATNTTPTTGATGNINGALNFNGSNSQIYVPISSPLTFTSMSFGGWVYIDSGNGYTHNYIFGGSADQAIIWAKDPWGHDLVAIAFGGDVGISWGDIPYNQWINIMFTASPTDLEVYINGEAYSHSKGEYNAPTNSSQSLSSFYLGADFNGSFFKGKMDNIRIYDTALTANEVSALYEADLGGGTPEPATAVGLAIAALGIAARRRSVRRLG